MSEPSSVGGSVGILIIAIAGAVCSGLLWLKKIAPNSAVFDTIKLPANSTTGWSNLAVIAAALGLFALLFSVIRGLMSKRGITGISVLFSVLALSYPAAIVLGAVVPNTPGPLK